jgi:predicted dehydrogenase
MKPHAASPESLASGRGILSRRDLLRSALGGAALAGAFLGGPAFTITPRRVLGAASGSGEPAPSGKPALGGVGVGGVGFGQLQELEKAGFRIASLCDVDDAFAKKAYDRWPEARRYRDFREMLQAEGDRIDAVYVGTPDHTHALIVVAALRRKKHVCCVKPLTRTVEECAVVLHETRKAGVATQVTAAANTGEEGCRTTELIAAGAIGAVREVHVWSDRPVWPQGMERPRGEDAVPAALDWKLWIGPAPLRPFKERWPEGDPAIAQVNIAGGGPSWYKSVYHPFNFRGWWDFGTGALGDMGCHYLNTPFRALRLAHPERIHSSATKVFGETAPLASIVTFDFPARSDPDRGDLPPLRLTWYDGGLKPPAPRELEGRLGEAGVLYIGDEGTMLGSRILDPTRAQRFAEVPRTLERRGGTWVEWYEAVRGGPAAGCDFPWAGPLTETVLLGNVAIRAGKRLEWDAAARGFKDAPEAQKLLRADYQNGWSFDGV